MAKPARFKLDLRAPKHDNDEEEAAALGASLYDLHRLDAAVIASGLGLLSDSPRCAEALEQPLRKIVDAADPADPEDAAVRNSLVAVLRERVFGAAAPAAPVGQEARPHDHGRA